MLSSVYSCVALHLAILYGELAVATMIVANQRATNQSCLAIALRRYQLYS